MVYNCPIPSHHIILPWFDWRVSLPCYQHYTCIMTAWRPSCQRCMESLGEVFCACIKWEDSSSVRDAHTGLGISHFWPHDGPQVAQAQQHNTSNAKSTCRVSHALPLLLVPLFLLFSPPPTFVISKSDPGHIQSRCSAHHSPSLLGWRLSDHPYQTGQQQTWKWHCPLLHPQHTALADHPKVWTDKEGFGVEGFWSCCMPFFFCSSSLSLCLPFLH